MRASVVRMVWSARGLALLACGLLALARPASPRGASASEPRLGPASPEARAVVLEGFVLLPDGNPGEGAVVVSSAGGQAVTDAAGSYRLAVDVPRETTRVQVTALGGAGGNLSASVSVALRSAAGPTRVDPLSLARGTACSPSWLPTFGGRPGMDATVYALTSYDDGSGPALYAGGDFAFAGGA